MKRISKEKIQNILSANKNLNFAAKANALEQYLRSRMDDQKANVIARQIVAAEEANCIYMPVN